jgi:PAS domain S-box-containing protein
MKSAYAKHSRGEDVPPYEYAIVTRDGKIISSIITSKLIDYEGEKALLGIVTDITERKKVEDALRQNQDLLEAITDNMGVGLGIISKDYRVLWVNKFIKSNVGEVEGKHCYSSLNTLDHICPDCGVRKIFEEGVERDSHEYTQIGVNGEPYYVEIIATPLKDKDGKVTAALEFVVDIAEKKRMQQKLQANEAKFRAISDSAIEAIFMFDEEDRITYWNPAAERIFGYTEKEVVGEKVKATLVPPRFHGDLLDFTKKLAMGDNEKLEGEIQEFPALRKDGTEFLMEISMAPLQLEDKNYIVAIARDITDRKKAETALDKTMNELMLVNEKLNVAGSLTRHDVRNKLCAVTGNAFLLKKKYADQAGIVDGLGKMEQACKEIGRIFDFAKMYEQLGVEELTYVDVEKVVGEAVALFSGPLSAKVINECHGLTLLADSFLRQLFYNLIENSLKHGENATRIRVHYKKVDQDKLIVTYEDDGVGISAENKQRLFTEGFSTSGTSGFGLYLIRKMMDLYGWVIQENGAPGRGAKFTITIPKINKNGKENFQIA